MKGWGRPPPSTLPPPFSLTTSQRVGQRSNGEGVGQPPSLPPHPPHPRPTHTKFDTQPKGDTLAQRRRGCESISGTRATLCKKLLHKFVTKYCLLFVAFLRLPELKICHVVAGRELKQFVVCPVLVCVRFFILNFVRGCDNSISQRDQRPWTGVDPGDR